MDANEAGSVPSDVGAQLPPNAETSSRKGLAIFKLIFAHKAIAIIAVVLLVIVAIGGYAGQKLYQSNKAASPVASRFDDQKIPLGSAVGTGALQLNTSQALSINGQLRANNTLVLSPSTQPNRGTAGQLYYDSTASRLLYHNGQSFMTVADTTEVEKLQTQLQGSASQEEVASIAQQLQQIQSELGQIQVPDNIAQLDGVNNFSAHNTFAAGLTAANLSVSGATALGSTTASSLILSNPLGVGSGGTGLSSLPLNGVLIGQGTDPVAVATASGAGQCLVSTAGAPTFQPCPGGGGGVDSLNGLSGALTLSNASASGSTIVIDDATTSSKGIASFNAANLTVSAGAVNTIQNISTTAAPLFNGLTVTNNLSAGTLSGDGTNVTNVNAAQLGGQVATFYLNASNISSGTLNDARLSANVAQYNAPTANFSGSLQQGGNDVCTTAGNCIGSGAVGGSGTAGTIAVWDGSGFTLTDSLLSESAGVVTVSGDLVADNLQGNGAGVTNVNAVQLNGQTAAYYLNASNVSAGTLADARLSANVTLQGNVFNGAGQLVQLNASSQLPAVSGALLTDLDADQISAGTLSDARLSSNVALYNAATANFTGTLQQGGFNVCTTAGNCTGTGGGVTTPGGTAGQLAVFSGAQSLVDSIISDNGSTVTIGGTLAVNTITPTSAMTVGSTSQALTLQGNGSTQLTVTSGGTTNSLAFATPSGTNKSVVIPNASGTVVVSASGPLSIDANGNISCATCTTSGGGGGGAVDSLNGLNGSLTLANASGSGSTITIDDASTTAKGIASFNSSNFTVSAGAVNTAQNISVTSTPSFAGLTLNGNLSIGTNSIVTNGATINSTELDVLDNGIDESEVTGTITDVTAGNGLAGGASSGNATLNIASANGGITVNADNIALTLQPAGDGMSSTTSSGSGLEILSGGLALLQGCGDSQVLKWNETTDMWMCAIDIDTDTDTDTGDEVSVNGTGAAGANFINTIASGTSAGVTWSLNNTPSPDEISIVISSASATQAGSVTTGIQTFAGDKTFNNAVTIADLFTANGNITLETGDTITVNGDAISDFTGTGLTVAGGALQSTLGTTIDSSEIVDGTIVGADIAASTITNSNLVNSSLTVTAGSGLVNGGAVSLGGTTTLNIASANGGIAVNADNIALTLQPTGDGLSTTNSSGSGLEILSGGLALLQGCSDSQTLKWNETTDVWMCANDIDTDTDTDTDTGDEVSVNGTGAAGANFINSIASGTSAGVTWSLNNTPSPDEISIVISNASATEAGTVTTSVQTFAGDKTFNGQIIASGGINLGTQTLQGTTSVIDFTNFDVLGNGDTTIGGTLTVNQLATFNENVTVAAGKSLTINGGTTGTRPSSPTEGMIYFDTDTKQLLTYANGKWQADRSEAVIVAASNSTQTDKDAADYVATGTNDGATVNTALATLPASGGKIYLMKGTYTLGATSINMPNNTTLAGSGTSTILAYPNAMANATYKAITNTDVTTGTHVSIRDIMIDGNRDNQTTGNFYGIYFDNMGSGTGASAIDGGKIDNVIVKNIYGWGIYLTASSHNTISGNTATRSNLYGISLSASSNSNTVTGNMVQYHTNAGIHVSASSHNTISGNTAQGNNYGIFFQNASSNTVTGNTTQGGTNYGMRLDTSSNNTITGNTIRDNGTRGITLLTSSNSNNISGNSFSDNGGASANNAIYLDASDSNSITSNVISDISASTTNYAININNSTADTNYLADNTLGGSSVQDLGAGTIYGGQVNSSGNFVIQPAGTIELMKNTNVTGALTVSSNGDFNGSLTVGSANQFVVSNAGVVTSGTWQGGTIGLAYGGTNNTTYTTNGIVYSNGTALVSTAAGTTGQCLLATTGAAPVWGACPGGGGSSFVQGGNSFSTTATLGTNDAYSLVLETANSARLTIDTVGFATFSGNVKISGAEVRQDFNKIIGTTAGWFKLGTLSLPQDGLNAKIRLYGGSQYIASDAHNSYVELFVRTSNGTSTNGSGFGASAVATRYGRDSLFASQIKLQANLVGSSATSYDVYINTGPHIGEGFYSVETSTGGSWAEGIATAVDPGVNGSLVYEVPFEFSVQNLLYANGTNVGIGTTGPNYRLDVQGGDINTSGSISTGATTRITATGVLQNVSHVDAANFFTGGSLSVTRGGTGTGTFTSNGILYGNGTGAIQATAAGTTGQCLLATTGSAPTWGACTSTTLQGSYNASSPATIDLTNNKNFTINATDQSTDPSIVFNLQCVTCSTDGGRFAIQDAGVDIFRINPNGDIILGTTANNMTLTASNGYKPVFSGNARNSKVIRLHAEYPSVVLAADGSNNTGTLTSGYDNTSSARMNYYKWTTTQGSNQDYDIVVQVPLPSDFDGWDTSNPLAVTAYTSSTSNGTIALEVRDSSDAQICNFVSVTPGASGAWATNNTACTLSTGTYTAGNYITLRLRLQAPNGGDTRVGNIILNYKSKF